MKKGKLKSIKPKVFRFKKGQNWDGDEEIIHYLEDLLVYEGEVGDFPVIKEDTFITIMCARRGK